MLKRLVLSFVLAVGVAVPSIWALNAGAPTSATRFGSTSQVVNLLRSTVSMDYEPFDSPALMQDQADLSAVGRVVDVVPANVKMGPEDPQFAIVVVEVEDLLKFSEGAPVQRVNVMLRKPSNVDASEMAAGLIGSQVVVVADATAAVLSSGDVEGVLFEPLAQGLLLAEDDGSGAENVWAEEAEDLPAWEGIDSIGEMREALGE